jgi:hypothetical protein
MRSIIALLLLPMLGVGSSAALSQEPAKTLAATSLMSPLQAPAPNSCADLRAAVDKAAADGKKSVDAALKQADDQTQGDKQGIDACAKGYITWDEQHIALDVPEFTMRDQTISLDLPQVTLVQQKISFDTPSVRCDNEKVGQYPEFYCDTHTVIPQCTVKWSDIITKVCKTFMERQEIIMGIPEFKIARTSFVMGVPEVKMNRQDWYFHLPVFHLTSGCIGAGCQKQCEDAANKYQNDYQSIVSGPIANAKQSTAAAASQFNQCFIGSLTAQRDAALGSRPVAWCRSDARWRVGPPRQAAMAGRLTVEVSLKGAMVSRLM